MVKFQLTIGLFDKDTEKQEIRTKAAKSMIADTLLNRFHVFAFTMMEAEGVYKMGSSGNIVREPSIRIEIVTDESGDLNMADMVEYLKVQFNQESIMVETFGMVYDCKFI